MTLTILIEQVVQQLDGTKNVLLYVIVSIINIVVVSQNEV